MQTTEIQTTKDSLIDRISKLTQDITKLTSENRALKLEMLSLGERIEKLEQNSISGQGSTGQRRLSREEMNVMLLHKLAQADLGEIVKFQAEQAGMSETDYIRTGLARRHK